MFAVRFAEYHQRRINSELQDAAFDLITMLRDDIAPKSWWAVVLSDAVDLLQYCQYIVLFYHMRCRLTHLPRSGSDALYLR